jgi:alpha-methylacyl-CoA racemase
VKGPAKRKSAARRHTRAASSRLARPLSGMRVVDFSQYAPAAYAGVLLADLGAQVTRIDRIGTPDPVGEDGLSRGKRSIALNLKLDAAVEVARRLLDRADVLIEGFRPGVMERFGLGPKIALGRNPRLVYARITGWGQSGPLAPRAGHDINYLAIAGTLALIGRRGEAPVPPPALLGDFAAGGLSAAFGIVSALLFRERTGRGQVIDAALVDGLANLGSYFFTAQATGEWGPRGTNAIDTGAPYYDVYRTADDRWLAVGALEPQFYAEFIRGLGLDREALPARDDPANWPALRDRFAAVIRGATLDHWAWVFEQHDACVTPVLELAEVAGHPHNAARKLLRKGPKGLPRPSAAPRLAASPSTTLRAEPRSGASTRAVLAELGYTAAQVARMLRDGAAATARRSRP